MLAFTSLISSKNSKLFREHNSSNLCCFSFNKVFELPKATRLHSTEANLHFLILSNSTTIGLPRPTSVDQASCIIVSQLKWEAHFSSNLREIFFSRFLLCCVLCNNEDRDMIRVWGLDVCYLAVWEHFSPFSCGTHSDKLFPHKDLLMSSTCRHSILHPQFNQWEGLEWPSMYLKNQDCITCINWFLHYMHRFVFALCALIHSLHVIEMILRF